MSFLTDLFEGNFGNLGTDIAHAPSSLAAHPAEIAEVAGGIALPFLGLGAAGLLGGAGDVAAAGTDLGATLDAAAAEGGPAAVADTLDAATPAELASVAPDLAGADAAVAGDLGAAVGDSLDSQAVADAFVAQDTLGLDAGGVPGDVAVAAANVDPASAAFTPDTTDAYLGADYADTVDTTDYSGEATLPAGAGSTVATPGAATSPAGGGLAGISSSVGNVLNSPITKAAELALPLGLLGYNAIKGPGSIPPQATQAQINASGATSNVPLLNQTTQQDLGLANAYQVTPGMQADLDTQKQNAYNQLYQQLANEGVTNPLQSSQWVQGKAQIDQQIEVQKGQMVQQLVTQALAAQQSATQATSAADSTLLQVAQLQVQQDTNFQNALIGATQSFAMLAAFQTLGGNKFATTPAAQPTQLAA